MRHLLPLALLALACGGCGGGSAPSARAASTPAAFDSTLLTTTPGLDRSASLREMYVNYNAPFAPFTIIGNVHYVGAAGVSSFLITTPAGHFLLDGGFAETAPRIIANIQALGFSIGDVKYLLNSHAHYDHAGGLAALKMASGAQMVASAGDRDVLESGHIGYGPASQVDIAPVRVDRVIGDGQSLTLGGTTMVAFITSGHTRGCTSWQLDVRDASQQPHRVFIHCSASVGGQTLVPESYPGQVNDFRHTFDRLQAMHADVFLAAHGEFFDLAGRRQRQQAGNTNAFVDQQALAVYNRRMQDLFQQELARQSAGRQ